MATVRIPPTTQQARTGSRPDFLRRWFATLYWLAVAVLATGKSNGETTGFGAGEVSTIGAGDGTRILP